MSDRPPDEIEAAIDTLWTAAVDGWPDIDCRAADTALRNAIFTAVSEAQNDGHTRGAIGYLTLCEKYNALRERAERLRQYIMDTVEWPDEPQPGDLDDDLMPREEKS